MRAKKLFLGCELEGGLKKNGFTQIVFISKTFKINFMSWDTDLGSMSPFPLSKIPIEFLSLGKRHFQAILGGVHDFFSFDCHITLTLGENSNFRLLSWRKSQKKPILKIWRLYPLQFLQYYVFRRPHRAVHNWKVHWPCAFSMELQHRLQHIIKTSYTEQIRRAKVFKLSEYVVSMIFFRLRTRNLDFDLRWGLHSHRKNNTMHPPKIVQKDRFSNNKNLNCNFNSGNGFIDPRSISQDIKLVLKGFELIIIWGKPFFLRSPFSPQSQNSFLARTVSFFDWFL